MLITNIGNVKLYFMDYSIEKNHSVELAKITSLLFANCNEKEARHAAKFGLSAVESRCLRILNEQEILTVNQLANELSLTSSRVTRIVDGLVAKQVVQRITGENDRRVFNISLTSRGKKLTANLMQDHIKLHEEIIQSIPGEYHHAMLELLEQLNEAVAKWLAKTQIAQR